MSSLSSLYAKTCYDQGFLNTAERNDIKGLIKYIKYYTDNSICVDNPRSTYFDYTALHLFSEYGTEEGMSLLINAGADVDSRIQSGDTPLFSAIWSHRIENVELLIRHSCNLGITNKHGYTPLMRAAINEFVDATKILLQHYSHNIDAQNRYGDTALHCASKIGHKTIVSLLLDHGCDKVIRNKDGLTSEMLARSSGHEELADFIREYEPQL